MDFEESTEYLYSLGNEVSAMKLGLENIRKLLVNLGKPSVNIFKVQVAGTNGKGSVCAFLNSICISAGIKTGLYTSPHLISIRERIQINGELITESEFANISSFVRDTSELLVAREQLDAVPTFFEQVTAIALIAFANHGVNLAILETGLGGRLDATTAANAEIAAITRIDIDHQEYLGATLAEIAAEKASIIHTGSKTIIGEQRSEAMKVLVSFSTNLGVSPRLAEKSVATTSDSGKLKFETDIAKYEVEKLGLLGRHQIENAKIAILVAETLQDHFPIGTANIVEGLTRAWHPGRLEFSGRYLFDGAHNVAGAIALKTFLDEFVTQPITLIFGAMKEKDVAEIAEILFPKAARIILTRPDNSRALSAEDVRTFVSDTVNRRNLLLTDTVEQALATATEITLENDLILITGSLYLVGEAKKILNN